MLKSFKGRIAGFIFITVLVIVLAVCTISYLFIYNNIVATSIGYNSELVNQLCGNINLLFLSVQAQNDALARAPALRFYENNFLTVDIPQPSEEALKKLMWDAAINNANIDDISIMFNEKKTSSLFNMYPQEVLLPLASYYKKSEILVESKFVPLMHENRNGQPALSCIRAVNNSSSQKDAFFVLTSIQVDEILSLLRRIDLGPNSGSCLADKAGVVQYSTVVGAPFWDDMNALLQKNLPAESNSFVEKINGVRYIISVNRVGNSNLWAAVYTPLSNMTQSANQLRRTLFISVSVLFLGACLLIFRLSNWLTHPIVRLSQHMQQQDSSKELAPITPISNTLETKILYETYNHLLDTIRSLIARNATESSLKRKAELLALQYQINPHFLYNTLDSINAMAIIKDEPEISAMTTSLAHLMRTSISQMGEFVSVQEEIDHVKAYLEIQKIRYNEKFESTIVVEPSIQQHRVIKLILQPLVENAIYHGIEPMETPGSIHICARACGNSLILQVKDNGAGIEEAAVRQINQNLRADKTPESDRSVGLYNVNNRIKMYYGCNCAMYFESVLNRGTTATIILPLDEKGLSCEPL